MGDIQKTIDKSKCNLSQEQLTIFTERINLRIAEIGDNLKEEDSLATDSGNNGFEENEIAISQTQQLDEVRSYYIPRFIEERIELVAVIELLQKGDFSNKCRACGKFISFERLMFAPETKTCQCFKQ